MLNARRRLVALVPAVVVLVAVAGLGDRPAAPVEAHSGDHHIEFGAVGTGLDADTIRKVEPRRLTITAGETVTFHVNGSGHQVLVLKAGVDIEAIGAEGIDADRSLPDTPLAPEVYPQPAAGTGAGPVAGPGRWDANGACPGGAGDVI